MIPPELPVWLKPLIRGFFCPLVFVGLLEAGCATFSNRDVVIHESPSGAVTLQELSKKSYHAAHPVSLSPSLLARILDGVRVQEDARLFQGLMSGKPKKEVAFSQEDSQFLAPLIAEALARATPKQVVRFRVIHQRESGRETTGGALYAMRAGLYLTLTQYRVSAYRGTAGSKIERNYSDRTGLTDRRLLFYPEGVHRGDVTAESGLVGKPHLTTLIIDYQLLAKLPREWENAPPQPVSQPEQMGNRTEKSEPASTANPSGDSSTAISSDSTEVDSLKERMSEQDREIKALQEELRSLQRQVGDQ